MKAPSTALLTAFSPLWRTNALPWTARGCLAQQQQCRQQPHQQKADFSSSPQRSARKNRGGEKKDMRITLIRYHLWHGTTPRPLRFSRNRALRHWTIHRAWTLYQNKLRVQRERTLERQYNSMASACEALRLIDGDGMTVEERERLGATAEGKPGDVGRLYRIAMRKADVYDTEDIWKGVPIEYAKIQTDYPSRDGWNHAWTR